jgi:hypothetical protein
MMNPDNKETLVVDLFHNGNLFKKDVRISLAFYLYNASFPNVRLLDDTPFQKKLIGMYKPSPVGAGTLFTTKWYITSSKPSSLGVIKWESIRDPNSPFEGKGEFKSLTFDEYERKIKGKYLAFNVITEKKQRVGLSCKRCEKDASIVHMQHDTETGIRTPIDAYCSEDCYAEESM